MHMINSYRIQVFFLLATIAVGIFTLISISRSTEAVSSIVTQNGLIINQVNNTPYTGRIVDTLDNQIISFDVKNGMKNGEFIVEYINGKKAIVGRIINNKNEGKWSYYYPSGELESEGHFKNDVTVEKWIWYYRNGQIMEEGIYINGKREGLWKLYFEDGGIKKSVLFKKGNIVSSFNPETQVAS